MFKKFVARLKSNQSLTRVKRSTMSGRDAPWLNLPETRKETEGQRYAIGWQRRNVSFTMIEIKNGAQMRRTAKFQVQQVRICDLLSKSMVSTGDVRAKLHRIAST